MGGIGVPQCMQVPDLLEICAPQLEQLISAIQNRNIPTDSKGRVIKKEVESVLSISPRGSRLPVQKINKQLHPLRLYVMVYIQHAKGRTFFYSYCTMNCRDSLIQNKAKRFLIYYVCHCKPTAMQRYTLKANLTTFFELFIGQIYIKRLSNHRFGAILLYEAPNIFW